MDTDKIFALTGSDVIFYPCLSFFICGQFFKILADSHVLHFDRPAFAIFNRLFEAVAEFIEVREMETLVFPTKRDEFGQHLSTYLLKWSAKIEELDYRLEGPIWVDPYAKASNYSVENLAVMAGYFEIASTTPTEDATARLGPANTRQTKSRPLVDPIAVLQASV